MIGETLGFIGAGLETSAVTIIWVIIELCHHPKMAEEIRQEYNQFRDESVDMYSLLPKLKFLDRFLCEVQRLHSVVYSVHRTNLEAVQILGYDIPAGVSLMLI